MTKNIKISGQILSRYEEILTKDALNFISELHIKFNKERIDLLNARQERQSNIAKGNSLGFLEETKNIRESKWKIKSIPKDLLKRQVEITGPPVPKKMFISALNCGSDCYMTDFEDSLTPSFKNLIEGQLNIKDAIDEKIDFTDKKTGKTYKLNDKTAILLVRPRGLHLSEKNILVDGERISGTFFDLGLTLFHNAKKLVEKGSGPYFYLPKIEHYLECRLFEKLLSFCEKKLNMEVGTIKVTVLVETISAVFQMEEFLWELKNHIVGLNAGRWDYLFSYQKVHRNNKKFLLPDRSKVNMFVPFMTNYNKLLVDTCHKRGAFGMGGMSAQVIAKSNPPEFNKKALDAVKKDKTRELNQGNDGAWVAHPSLVGPVKDIFEKNFGGDNQLEKFNNNEFTKENLLSPPNIENNITESGLRENIQEGIEYMGWWLSGLGCSVVNYMMADAATCEVSRAQLWMWVKHKAKLNDGRIINFELVEEIINDELKKTKERVGEETFKKVPFKEAAKIFKDMVTKEKFDDFLTISLYEKI